jgi:hypothetical protein
MRDLAFFDPVQQSRGSLVGYEVSSPTFYYDLSSITAHFATPLDRIRSLLPSDRLHPVRIGPGKAVTTIACYEYRDSDIGPYNELFVGFPVTIDRRAPMLLEMLRGESRGTAVYVWQLPVSSAIARDLGIAVAGYPKILADITFEDDGGWLRCRTAAAGQEILTLSIRRPEAKLVNRRWPVDAITVRGQHIQRTPLVSNIRHLGGSWKAGNAQLEIGDHPIGQEMKALGLGRVLATRHAPDSQLILDKPIEGWPASHVVARPEYPESEAPSQPE